MAAHGIHVPRDMSRLRKLPHLPSLFMNSRFIAGAVATLTLTLGIVALVSGGPPPVDSPEVLTQAPLTTSSTSLPSISPGELESMLPEETTTTSTIATTTTVAETTTTEATTSTTAASSQTTTTTVAATTTTVGGSSNSSYEASFASMINDHRAANGLPALTRDSSLDAEARAWSELMASEGSIFHSDLSRFLPPWSTAGENVAVGGSVSSVFGALVASSGHNANMLHDGFTAMGVGVWVDSNGTIWTTHIFAG